MEHLNRTVKECITCLGANQTDTAILRVSHALGTLVPVLDQFDRVNNVPDISGTHTRKNPDKDIQVMLKELQKSNIFLSANITQSLILTMFYMDVQRKIWKNGWSTN